MLSVRSSIRVSVRDVVSISSVCMDGFSPNFVSSRSWNRDEPIRFLGEKVKGQSRSMPKCAKNIIIARQRHTEHQLLTV